MWQKGKKYSNHDRGVNKLNRTQFLVELTSQQMDQIYVSSQFSFLFYVVLMLVSCSKGSFAPHGYETVKSDLFHSRLALEPVANAFFKKIFLNFKSGDLIMSLAIALRFIDCFTVFYRPL